MKDNSLVTKRSKKIFQDDRPINSTRKFPGSFLFLLLISSCYLTGIAQDYHGLAKSFLISHSTKPSSLSDTMKFELVSEKGNLLILESLNPESFIIFHRHHKNPKVLAYSTDNIFSCLDDVDPAETPFELLTGMQELTRKQVMKSGFEFNRIPVGPMLQTKWSQERWYNLFCPYDIKSDAGEHDMVGCVATAMGQIIRYYGKWNNFIIDKQFTRFNKTMTSSAAKYSWPSMINEPMNYDLEVCRLLSDLGILVEMNYGPDCSSKGFGYARKKGFSNIGYDEAITDWRNQNENWLERIYENLENYHPVMIGGGNHAYICDGYDEAGRLHFNMGWGGRKDGYYDPSCVSSYDLYSKEGVFDAFPVGYMEFGSPRFIRVEEVNNVPHIVWSPPENSQKPNYYNVYYTDNDYFSVQDTIVKISDLLPGAHNILVSSVYPDGESIWIGPMSVSQDGEQINITDEAMAKAVAKSLSYPYLSGGSFDVSSGDLAKIRELNVEEPLNQMNLIMKMSKIQILNLDATKLKPSDIESLISLPYLQTLKLKKFKGLFPDLSLLEKLVELSFDSCQFEDLSFLNNLDNLMILEMNNCDINNFKFPDNLKLMAHLTISNCGLPTTSFLNSLPGLRKLCLTGCELVNLDIVDQLPKLTCLTISDNNFKTTSFFNYFPNLKMVNASKNNIETLDIHSEHPHLLSMVFTQNNIRKIQMSFDLKSVYYMNLSNNEFETFPRLPHLPNLQTLNISNNSVDGFRSCGIHGLEKLNISNNTFTNLVGIGNFTSLSSLDAHRNSISDIAPLINDFSFDNLTFLNLRNNPISKESFFDIVPKLQGAVSNLYLPDSYQPGSPCYPEVISSSNSFNDARLVTWFCEKNDSEKNYDIYMGTGDSLLLVKNNIQSNQAEVSVDRGEVYNWQIKANFQDTCFFSGIYKLRKNHELAIPFFEDFESFPDGASIATESSVWRLNFDSFDLSRNAVVSDEIWNSGSERALHIKEHSDISLELSHINVPDLNIEFDQYLLSGKKSNVRVNRINGININLCFDGYIGELFVNDALHSEFQINTNDWNHIDIHYSPQSKRFLITCNYENIYKEYHSIADDLFQVGSISFCPGSFENDHQDYDWYLDNVSIKRLNKTTYTEHQADFNCEASIYPNPANQYIKVKGLSSDYSQYRLVILNSMGQEVKRSSISGSYGRSEISIQDLDAGMYYYKISALNQTVGTGNILIVR